MPERFCRGILCAVQRDGIIRGGDIGMLMHRLRNAEDLQIGRQNAVEPKPVPAAPEDAVSGILQEARINLPIEIRFAVDDPSRFRMSLYGQDLILEAIPGFLFERMKRPEIRNVFSAAAQRITGVPVAVQVQELKPDQRSLRDLNELKQFPEVSFLS